MGNRRARGRLEREVVAGEGVQTIVVYNRRAGADYHRLNTRPTSQSFAAAPAPVSAQGTISGTLRAGDTFEPFFGWLVG